MIAIVFFRFAVQFSCLKMCVFGGSAVPQGGGGAGASSLGWGRTRGRGGYFWIEIFLVFLALRTARVYRWRDSVNRRRRTLNRRRLALNRRRWTLNRRRLALSRRRLTLIRRRLALSRRRPATGIFFPVLRTALPTGVPVRALFCIADPPPPRLPRMTEGEARGSISAPPTSHRSTGQKWSCG